MASVQKWGAILLDHSCLVGQVATEALQVFLWSSKIYLEQDTKALTCL